MRTPRWTRVGLGVCVVALAGATCDKNGAEPGKPMKPAAEATPAPAPGAAAPDEAGGDATPRAALVLDGVPGMDFSGLTPAAQRELASVFTDEFCYCGCPHTLGACLKQHESCQHAKRMALLAAGEAALGVPSTEIIVGLSKYYLSFRDRKEILADPRLCLGPADAKVTIVEFSDFECPYCAAAAPLLKAFVRKNPDVRVCYAPFPLQSHPNALPAAQAAFFAREKGKFWEMHDALFENQTSLSREKILDLGAQIGLDRAALQKAIESGQYLDEIRTIKDSGRAAGVDATPSLFINGRKFLLGLSSETLRHTVEDELEWQAHGGAWAKD